MGKFAKAETQAASVVKALQKNGAIRSLVTAKNYTDCLTRVCRYAKENRVGLMLASQLTRFLRLPKANRKG